MNQRYCIENETDNDGEKRGLHNEPKPPKDLEEKKED